MNVAPTNKAEKAGWRIVFQDEFDGKKLDTDKWQPQETTHGDESQHYKNDEKNIFLTNGFLHLRALREPFKNYAFTSGEIFSKVEFGQGTLCEVRCKIPKGKGLWPAFWFWRGLYGDTSYQEIDVFEFWCADTRRFSVSNHYFNVKKKKMNNDYKWIKPENAEGMRLDMSENFHTYTVYWDEKGIKVLFDNVLAVHLKK
ncbi:MAG: glycoside hydrolase family 16 protein, partial [Saprospiraceae bacterium]|nr:glycoside hydrolase family 16 protein [Saprospiraceae bacterium]